MIKTSWAVESEAGCAQFQPINRLVFGLVLNHFYSLIGATLPYTTWIRDKWLYCMARKIWQL